LSRFQIEGGSALILKWQNSMLLTKIFRCGSHSVLTSFKLGVAAWRPEEEYFTSKSKKSKKERERGGLLKTYSTSLTSRFIKFFMYRSCSKTSVLEQAHPLLQSCTNTRRKYCKYDI
jgi:hypothetical protein